MILLGIVMLQILLQISPVIKVLNCRKLAAGPCAIEADKKLVTI